MLKHDLLKATALQSKFCNLMPMTMVAGVFGGSYIIPQSIRFNDDDSAYMYRIPSVAGNRKTGTFHTDLKLCNLTLARGLFVAYSDASNYSEIILDAADKLIVTFRVAGTSYTWTSTRVLRDPGAWAGGLTVGWDTTASSGNRLSVEYGGEGVAGSWGTEVPLNTDTQFSNTVLHQIAARNTVGTPVNYGDFYLADVHGVDGAKVAGASFGKFNANGVWAPVEYVPGTVGAATTMAYVGQTVDTSTLTTFTFSSHAIGTASPDRKVIVGISSVGTGRWVTSMTIGGIAAKLVVRSAMSADHVALWQADVPTGTTADIVVTFNTTSSHCAIGVYEATGVGALYSTDLDITNSAAMPTSVTCPENGFIIGVAGCTVGTDTFSWTNLTEDFDQVIAGANHYSGASDTFGSHQSERVVTATPATPGTEQGTVVAAWGPVTNGAYGINGFHIDGSNSAALGEDQSGNGNNFTTSGLTSADQMLDSPTDDIGGTGASDFCTWNPLNKRSTSLLSDGNLKYVGNSGSFYATGGTIAVGSGKWYWEVTCPVVGGADNTDIGIALSSWVTTDHVSPVTPLGCYDSYNGKYYPVSSGTAGTYGATYTSGDVIGIALDLDNGAIWFSKNGTWQNSATIGEV
ncbi:MAG: hypothetical protein ISR46_06840, partial [Rhodospirillales bacterium]|nr:hypothetical protein [Rhodospirillales bacterium]